MKNYKPLFSEFLQSKASRMHFAAHSHHLWPNCTAEAHRQAWLDAAEHIDGKWSLVFEQVIPEAQRHIASQLSLPDPSSICFAPNTHELVVRLHSCLPNPATILTTDAEFHSFSRQYRRWQEDGQAKVQVVAAEPFETFGERFLSAAREGAHDLVFVSQVFFDSGFFVDCVNELADILRNRETLLLIDAYHAFMALPLSYAAIADQAFIVAGGYKYAMAGEGACFMHCPPSLGERPVNTGWFAGFGDLAGTSNNVGYAPGGARFFGSTFDPSGLYRFNAVQRMLRAQDIGVEAIHEHVKALQSTFLAHLGDLSLGELLPTRAAVKRGHFLTFRSKRAPELCAKLAERGVIVDVRGDRLRFGFGIYHSEEDVLALVEIAKEALL